MNEQNPDILKQLADDARRSRVARMLPPKGALTEDQVRQVAEDFVQFLETSGISIAQVSKSLGAGYTPGVLSQFKAFAEDGRTKYAGDASKVARAVNSYLERHAQQSEAWRPDGFITTEVAKNIIAVVSRAVAIKSIAMVCGDAGRGKTMTMIYSGPIEQMPDRMRWHVELVAEFLRDRSGQWFPRTSIQASIRARLFSSCNLQYITAALGTLRKHFGWDIETSKYGVRLASEPTPIVWPEQLDARIENGAVIPAYKQAIVKQLLSASIEHEGGQYLRASVAAKIIGIGPGVQTRWIKAAHIKPLRFKVPRGHNAPRGLVTAWPLEETIARAIAYRPMRERSWSDEEVEQLLELLGTIPIYGIAKKLGRTEAAVRDKMWKSGLSQRNAQGLLTTGDLARLFGVTRECIQHWCFHFAKPLEFSRSPSGDQVKLISPDQVRAFLADHPGVLKTKSKAVRDRVERYLMPLDQRRELA